MEKPQRRHIRRIVGGRFPYRLQCVAARVAENRRVRQLADAGDTTVVSRTVRLLYVQALLAGRRPLGEQERAMLTDSLSDLVALSLDFTA